VLLVHGWGGRGAQLASFVEPLVARGFSVLTFDAPGHGASAARWDGLADVALQPIAKDRELPNAAFPYALAIDGDGFLWMGTQNGLARWDGYRFRIYAATSGRAGGLPDNQARLLHTDAAGRLWIGTMSGLARYDRAHDRFISYRTSAKRPSGFHVDAFADGPMNEWTLTAADFSDPNKKYLSFSIAGGTNGQLGPEVQVKNGSKVQLTITLLTDLATTQYGEGDAVLLSSNGDLHSATRANYWPFVVMTPAAAQDAGITSMARTPRSRQLAHPVRHTRTRPFFVR